MQRSLAWGPIDGCQLARSGSRINIFPRITEKARLELQARTRSLTLAERRVILLANGVRSLEALILTLGPATEKVIVALVSQGYLQMVRDSATHTTLSLPTSHHSELEAPDSVRQGSSAEIHAAADPFIGRRSLATTRMFLFDICERMFSRVAPEDATCYRAALRDAKDRHSVMSVARAMIAEVELIAGHERADSPSERIAMLMPAATTEEEST